jgi:ribonuclease-3
VARGFLSVFARQLGFSKFLLVSNHMEKIHGRNYDRILEDTFESFICAMNLDLGFAITKDFLINIIEKYVNFSDILHLNNNYKDRIKHYYQKSGRPEPKYDISTELGPPTKRTFIINIYEVDNCKNKKFICKGYGYTKKEGEQNAAFNALKKKNLLGKNENYKK